jgi:hypothetical protein
VNGFGASARPGGVQPLGYLDVQRSRDAGGITLEGLTGSRMFVCPDVAPHASRVELNAVPENRRGDGQRDRGAPAPFRIRAAALIEVWDHQGPIRRFQSGA